MQNLLFQGVNFSKILVLAMIVQNWIPKKRTEVPAKKSFQACRFRPPGFCASGFKHWGGGGRIHKFSQKTSKNQLSLGFLTEKTQIWGSLLVFRLKKPKFWGSLWFFWHLSFFLGTPCFRAFPLPQLP